MTIPTSRLSDDARDFAAKTTVNVDFAAQQPEEVLEQLEANILCEMSAAWHAGRQTPAEEWLDRHPQIAARADRAVRLVYEEICLREERGIPVDSSEIYRRFPQWQNALQVLLDCHRLIEPERVDPTVVHAGQRLGELQLLSELGHGAVGRVFLATQHSLSDRPLVVKLISCSGDEHLSLARLQHTHIVPLYLAQDFPNENLRALCMPYLGGTSWAHLLDRAKGRLPAARSGQQLVELLEREQAEAPIATTFSGPTLRFLSRATYGQAVCWIGSCLADALHYAHQRGLVHLDIKPSNVLLAGDGTPMLLDFHLARTMIAAGAEPPARLGGTRGYMSPEQQLTATAVREGYALVSALDGRSDVYSLGALLYESLGDQLPATDEAISRRELHERNPLVGRGLSDILHKCLARDPEARYRDAGELATDLRRHLADLPLCGVPNHSVAERWKKWRRRKPHALTLASTGFLALVVLGVFGQFVYGERLHAAREALFRGHERFELRDYGAAVEQFETGHNALRWLPGEYDLKQSLHVELTRAQRARLAGALHDLVERLRFLESFENVPPAKLRKLERGCATIWKARAQIMQQGTSIANSDIESRLRTDLLDLTLLWADLRVRLAPQGETKQSRRDALTLLDEAQALYGSSPILAVARQQFAKSPASDAALETANQPVARTAWEHFAAGRFLFRSEKFEQAQSEFQRAIDLEPNAFWPNFYLTLSAYRLEQFEEALCAACVCVALSPASAECFYNRALAHQALQHSQAALDDFDKALRIDPTLAVAALHRGELRREMRSYPEALADLKSALALGAAAAEIHYQVALTYLAQKDRPAARASLREALDRDPSYSPALGLLRQLDASGQ
jgi:serine/threonine protein kinase/Tfp pilus assembly protein PilF